MNEKLSEAIISWVNSAGADAVEFASREIPLYIQEPLTWTIVHSLAVWLSCAAFLVAEAVLIPRMWRAVPPRSDAGARRAHWGVDDSGDAVFQFAITVLCAFASILIAIPGLAFELDWLQAWLAPRVFLVEYAAELAK